jgi:hypothetical protein
MGLSLAWRAMVVDLNFATLGVAATVTRPAPDDTPIETTAIWVTPTTQDVPGRPEYQRRDPIRVMALKHVDVPTVPKGTRIEAAERDGEDARTWRVDAVERVEADHVRVIVMAVPSGA